MESKMDCIFCKIIAGEIPAAIVYENGRALAFDDINPRTPVHTLVVPKEHLVNVNDINSDNADIMADLFLAVREVVRLKGVEESGYRVLMNNGKAANQEVDHMHIHIFGGRESLGPMIKPD
jgi:histidine triad (HIT) family protein